MRLSNSTNECFIGYDFVSRTGILPLNWRNIAISLIIPTPMYSVGTAGGYMDAGVRLEVLWSDADVFEVRVSAWNGRFGGSANTYLGIGGLAASAQKLEGFPSNPSDKRGLDFGVFGSEVAGGAATMNFYCADSAGHASVEVRIESDHREKIPAQSVLLVAAVEPAAVDSFVSDLRRLEADQRGVAFLRASG